MTLETHSLNTWIEVSEAAHAHNLSFFRRRIGPQVELSAVVKANAYGHGMEWAATSAARHGADSFCVHSLDEALRLRRSGFSQDVLIMGHVPLRRLDEALSENFRVVLYDLETARCMARWTESSQRRARVHLKLETGTYRQGIDETALPRFLDFFHRHPSVVVEGAYTHFANIEDTTHHEYARQQMQRFEAALASLRLGGITPPICHAACSAATVLFPETHFQMVRLGVSQYGQWSSKETFLSYQLEQGRQQGEIDTADTLRPVLTWKARVSQVKDVPADAFVGYGCTYQTTRPTRIAVLPVGYSDGYDRQLSNRSWVLIRGRRAPVRGRICMNLLMADVTDVPEVNLEDEAVLLGRQGDQEIHAGQLADLAGTIPYEILARISSEIPRRPVA